MGSKTINKSQNLKAHKCGVCNRTFSSAPALASHNRIHFKTPKHSPISDNRVAILRKGIVTSDDVKPKAEIMPKKRVIRSDMEFKKDIHFACPRCDRLFKSYFSSRQHIVRYHCVNYKDEPVPENSPDLIRPIPRERCLNCQVTINSDEFHICSLKPEDFMSSMEQFVCLGCQQNFASIKLFDIHIPGLHSDGVQTMFFQKLDDLLEWVAEIEDSTDTNFKLMNYTNSKQIYRCTYLSDDTNTNISMCPASIHIHEFPKGYQVNFFTQHHGHDSKIYQVKEKYKQNQISSVLNETNGTKDSITDPKYNYHELKRILEKVIHDTAKISPIHVKKLMGIALEMSAVLKTYEEIEETSTPRVASNLNDNQITDALIETDKSQRKKRKSSISPIPHIEMVFVEDTPLLTRRKSSGKRKLPLIVNSYSLNENNNMNVKKEKEQVTLTKTRFLDSLSDSPSFNDTYKDFLGKSLNEIAPISNRKPKKTIVKTKMGQFKPNSPKKAKPLPVVKVETPPSPVNFDSLPKDITYEVREQENDYNILVLKF